MPTLPTYNAIVCLPAEQFPNYVGGQADPWALQIDWNAPCLGTITVTSDYGLGPQTVVTLNLTSTSGTYYNGFDSPPPVAQVTPWTFNFIAALGDQQQSAPLVLNLLPLTMQMGVDDNKIIAFPGLTTTAYLSFNAPPSPTWFPSLSVQSSSQDVNVAYPWPDLGNFSVEITLSAAQDVTTTFPVTISAELDSSGGVVPPFTGRVQLTVQPPGDLGTCDDDPNKDVGCPINVSTGNVWIQEKDYSLPGLGGGLQLTRTWNSKWQNLAPPALVGLFGHSWQSNFEEQLFFQDPSSITYYRSDGSSWLFEGGPSNWYLTSQHSLYATLSYVPDQYVLTLPDGTQRIFNSGGRLLATADRNGNQTTLTYDGSNRLSTVTDAAGRSLTFSYGDPNNPYQATAVQDAVGLIANYVYDSSSRLLRATYADGSSLNFAYGSSSMITSVTDGQGKVLESHTYDAANRGLTSSRAGGADLVTLNFPSTPGGTQLNDSLGNTTTYNLQYINGHMEIGAVAGPGCASCGGRGNKSFDYDIFGERTSSTDALGNLTCYTYDGAGDILTKTTLPPGSTCPGGIVFDIARLAKTGPTGSRPLAPSGGTATISSAGGSGSASSPFCTGGGGNSPKVCAMPGSGASPTTSSTVSTVKPRALSPRPAIGIGGSPPPLAR